MIQNKQKNLIFNQKKDFFWIFREHSLHRVPKHSFKYVFGNAIGHVFLKKFKIFLNFFFCFKIILMYLNVKKNLKKIILMHFQ
jgi:hypothetical protein